MQYGIKKRNNIQGLSGGFRKVDVLFKFLVISVFIMPIYRAFILIKITRISAFCKFYIVLLITKMTKKLQTQAQYKHKIRIKYTMNGITAK